MKKIVFSALVASVVLSGCSTMSGKSEDQKYLRNGYAKITNGNSDEVCQIVNSFRFAGKGAQYEKKCSSLVRAGDTALATIAEIDGNKLHGVFEAYVQPGYHQVKLQYQNLTEESTLKAEAGIKYLFTGSTRCCGNQIAEYAPGLYAPLRDLHKPLLENTYKTEAIWYRALVDASKIDVNWLSYQVQGIKASKSRSEAAANWLGGPLTVGSLDAEKLFLSAVNSLKEGGNLTPSFRDVAFFISEKTGE